MVRYEIEDLFGNGLDKLLRVGESKTVTRKFKNHLKRLGIYENAFVPDKSRAVYGAPRLVLIPGLSNRQARGKLFHVGETLESLKTFPRRLYRPVVGRFSEKTKRFVKPHPRLPNADLFRPRRSERRDARKSETVEKLSVKTGGNGPVQSPSNPDGRPRSESNRVHTSTTSSVSLRAQRRFPRSVRVTDDYISYLGGPLLPAKHHTKYWYFLRKRGHFALSEHHPYGDEAGYYPDGT